MKIFFYGLIAMMLLTGCRSTEIRYSDVLKEKVRVRDLLFTPAMHGDAIGPTFGMSMSGNATMGIAVTSVDVEEKYNIVFECQHGSFVIPRADLWKKLHKDSTYTCLYREEYLVYLTDDHPDSSSLRDYDFLGLEEFPELADPVTPDRRLR